MFKINVKPFLEVFGEVTIAQIVQIALAIGFLLYCGKKFRDYLVKRYEAEQQKDKAIKEALAAVKKYPEYRQQSLDIQEKLENEIKGIRKSQEENSRRIDEMEKNTERRERNKCRDRLLQSFRFYISEEKNPLQAWTRMESEAFWELFKDYEDMKGDGYMHTEVQPAMNLLEIVELSDTERVAELMKSRG